MTKNGFWYAGALIIAISGGACAVSPGGEPIRLAQADTYVINKQSEPTLLAPYRVGACNASAASCVNKVSVSDGCSKDPSLVHLDFDDLHVPRERRGRPMPIIWPLTTAKWKYQASGIRFYLGGGEFTDKGSTAQGWVQIDRAQTGGGFNYEISVINTETGERCTRDPTIANDW